MAIKKAKVVKKSITHTDYRVEARNVLLAIAKSNSLPTDYRIDAARTILEHTLLDQ